MGIRGQNLFGKSEFRDGWFIFRALTKPVQVAVRKVLSLRVLGLGFASFSAWAVYFDTRSEGKTLPAIVPMRFSSGLLGQ